MRSLRLSVGKARWDGDILMVVAFSFVSLNVGPRM